MKQLIFSIFVFAFVFVAISCEKAIDPEYRYIENNVTLHFSMTNADAKTRALSTNYFSKLNIMLFDEDGERVFDKVKTQTADDDDWGTLSLKLTAGTYTVVAVGHSSHNSATIKSPEVVQFTASDGEKLTDTFCHCSQIVVSGDAQQYDLDMYRVGAMIQFCLKDTEFPANFSHFLMEYTGGSANFNPTTLEGITKSSQSEKRTTNGIQIYQAFTFPYMAASCNIKMTCSGLDSDGTVIRRRVFDAIPVTRNRITTYTGPFFEDGDGVFTQSDFSFLIHADWDGEDKYDF
jgi:putative component of membrane protein insertase Oxa1/YidC/SpoIIIJ protein YidD